MQRGFLKGLLTGGILGAFMSMIKQPQRKPSELMEIKNNRRKSPRRSADRMLKEVTRSVNGLIKKK